MSARKGRCAPARASQIHVSSSTKRRLSLGLIETLATVQGRCHFSLYRNIAIGVWVAQADKAGAEAALNVAKTMAERCPDGHSSVAFLLDGLPGPDPEAMPLLTKLWAKRPNLACSAMILEGSGFWASGLRSMVNNSRREGGGEVPLKIGTTVAEVVDWFSTLHAQKTGVAIPVDELADALTFARQLGERARSS
jgi:hypothetical protein